MFRSKCPTSALIAWCRALGHGLGVGLTPLRVFRQQSKTGPTPLRAAAGRIADHIENGDSISDAMKYEIGLFPVLFLEGVAVGEASGRLSDVLTELERHYETVQAARNRFLGSLAWPVFSLSIGILVLTLMIAVLSALGSSMDPLGLGLTGVSGAIVFAAIGFGGMFAVAGAAASVANDEHLKAKAMAIGLGIPGLAACVRAFALARFSLAWRFMAEAGVKADKTMAASLRATANRSYRDCEEKASKMVRKGKEVTDALATCGPALFPDEFIEATRIGEESGRLAEVMGQQAKYYQDESERKLKFITRIAGASVYGLIALLLIVSIFKMYFSVLDPFSNPEIQKLNKMSGGGLY